MNKTTWIIFSILAVGILALLVVYSGSGKTNVSNVDINSIQVGNSQDGNIADHLEGNSSSKATLIEYGDFECPGCGAEHAKVKGIVSTYIDKIRYIFRNFPLASIHPNAKAAAGAAEAAGLQGKYWEMHNKLYDLQSEWVNLSSAARDEKFVEYAKSLGLDANKFQADISSEAVNNKINYDYALGQKAGVDATPSFFLNGTKLDPNTWSNDAKFTAAIDTELAKKQ